MEEPNKISQPDEAENRDHIQALILLLIFPWATEQTKVKRHLSGPLLVDGRILISEHIFKSIQPGQAKTLGELLSNK